MMICVIQEPYFSFHFLLSLEFANLQKREEVEVQIENCKS